MDIHGLIAFTLIFAVACASPGPTLAALVVRVLGRGTAGAPAFCVGLLTSDVIWLSAAVFGLGVLAEAYQPVFLAVRYLGAAYLLYLAWKLWTAPPLPLDSVTPVKGEGIRLFFAAIAVGCGNPKTMLFYLALLPTVLPLQAVTATDFVVLAAIVLAVYSLVLLVYVALAARARRALASPRLLRWVGRATGGVMAGAAVAVATRQ
jgi:threonine/homoserine/homoserine lactone efflux protein